MVTALTVTAQTNFREMSLDQAVAAAKAEQKLVFVDVITSWCGPCKMMARDVFPQKGLGDFMNAKFVCIKIDAEKGEGPAVAKTYGVEAYPTFLLLDTEKKLVGKSVGMKEAEDFKAEMERLLNPAATPERLKARYEAGERSADLIKTYAVVLKEEAANGGRREYAQKIEGIKKMVLDYCKNQKEFVSALLDAGASLKFVYEGQLSGESFSMEISRDELRQALQGEVMSAQEKMEISIIIANAQTPMQLVEGITMTAMQQEGDCVYYIYEVTPEAFANIESNLNEVKDNVRYMLGQLGEVEKNDLRNIPNANKNLGYRYTCPDTGQSVEFFFTQSQLIDILR
jgi:thiol-disulfide isomerase/thioredoxin